MRTPISIKTLQEQFKHARSLDNKSHESDAYNTATTVDDFVKEELKKNLSNNYGF